ncbi:ATP-binding protein [Streptomyces sp. DSM 44917]|uniref:ATP-binding protein n=1 Tax=Streptomyces boetiae TaxID=3075541 RepID=A0ABU2LGZ4_9ACTN|nr:ATP-binding protein [Streptomyces sp. DSM 44917]MDT0310522.1 ATP-binding protein [Streptomyces sp. DSM 44917]
MSAAAGLPFLLVGWAGGEARQPVLRVRRALGRAFPQVRWARETGGGASGQASRDHLLLRVAGEARCASSVRRAVRERLGGWGLSGHEDAVLLVVGELFGNAVAHAPGEVMVEVVRHAASLGGAGEVYVAVTDRCPQRVPVRREAGPDAENGRGLALVERLADAWGTNVGRTTKTVWAAFTPQHRDRPGREAGGAR